MYFRLLLRETDSDTTDRNDSSDAAWGGMSIMGVTYGTRTDVHIGQYHPLGRHKPLPTFPHDAPPPGFQVFRGGRQLSLGARLLVRGDGSLERILGLLTHMWERTIRSSVALTFEVKWTP